MGIARWKVRNRTPRMCSGCDSGSKPLTFVCTVGPDDFEPKIFLGESKALAMAVVGFDDETDNIYSITVGIERIPGGKYELFFHLVEVDSETDSEYLYWSGRDTQFIRNKADRNRILQTTLLLCAMLIKRANPDQLTWFTCDENPPEQALVKYFLIIRVIEECGYEVRTADPYNGRWVWFAERGPG
ncbi:hypothetical protein [Methylobacterium nodulans]|uniref:hypothetical protein n=1 Tax=Methylobacterium nodulans TaxID=114616 RepID=UPI0012EDD072|nr:hypothetical protein [Methylobacterium nodulans]